MPINRIPKLRGVGLPGAFDPDMLASIADGNVPAWNATNRRWEATSEIADSFLSANVPLLDAANTFEDNQTISSAQPQLFLTETDGTADNQRWRFVSAAEIFSMAALNDAGSVAGTFFTAQRTGTNIDSLALTADFITLNGVFRNTGTDQTGVAVSAAGIHAALVNLGLITA